MILIDTNIEEEWYSIVWNRRGVCIFQTEQMNNHLGIVLTVLVFCYFKMSLQTGHVEQIIDHLNSYISGQLLSIGRNKYTSNLDTNACLKIKELDIKWNFRGSRGGKYKPRIQHQNRGIHEKWLKSLPRQNTVYWKGKDTRFFLTNVQSIINKLDMVLHHMEVEK